MRGHEGKKNKISYVKRLKEKCGKQKLCENTREKECEEVTPVGPRRSPCLDLKAEILGHSGSALHQNVKGSVGRPGDKRKKKKELINV